MKSLILSLLVIAFGIFLVCGLFRLDEPHRWHAYLDFFMAFVCALITVAVDCFWIPENHDGQRLISQ